MDAHSVSATESRDGHASRQDGSNFDEYDELSDCTVGTSSPVGKHGAKSSQHSNGKNHRYSQLSPSVDSTTPPLPIVPTRCLSLNNQNLHGFARGMQTGEVPLRADVIPDDEYVNKMALREPRDVSDATVVGGTQDGGELGSDAADSNTYYSNGSLRGGEASLEGTAWNNDRASVDAQAGSPTRRHADPLSTANLEEHLHELSSGPAPLAVENIVSNIPLITKDRDVSTNTAVPERASVSAMVEPSEVDTMSYSEATSPLRNHSAKQTSVEDVVEDMWSIASTRGRGDNMQAAMSAAAEENPHALSKENLRQLRHQLESGETPLRPEVLAGLGSVVRVMAQGNSKKSASTAVEAPPTENRSKQLGNTVSVGSPGRSLGDGVQSPITIGSLSVAGANVSGSKSAAVNGDAVSAAKDGDASPAAGMSFHSTLVEVPATEAGDLGATGTPGTYRKHPFNSSNPAEASNQDAYEEDRGEADEADEEDGVRGKSSTEDSREGQNESVFNMTEDDGVDDMADGTVMIRHMRELFKLVQEGQRDQLHLRQQVLEQRGVIERLQETVQVLEAELSALKKH